MPTFSHFVKDLGVSHVRGMNSFFSDKGEKLKLAGKLLPIAEAIPTGDHALFRNVPSHDPTPTLRTRRIGLTSQDQVDRIYDSRATGDLYDELQKNYKARVYAKHDSIYDKKVLKYFPPVGRAGEIDELIRSDMEAGADDDALAEKLYERFHRAANPSVSVALDPPLDKGFGYDASQAMLDKCRYPARNVTLQ